MRATVKIIGLLVAAGIVLVATPMTTIAHATSSVDDALAARDEFVSTLESARETTHGRMVSIGNTSVVLMWSEIQMVPPEDTLIFRVYCPEEMIPISPAGESTVSQVTMSAPLLGVGADGTQNGWYTTISNDEVLAVPAMVGVLCMEAPQ